ncbi:MAG: hypothetical protein K2H50_06930 [Paramuribaculum sp.]|nr:hypothetical protein [Paramuribaculum sp.]
MKKRNDVIGISFLFVSMFVVLAGCSTDSPLPHTTDYRALRLGKMDLSDAVSLGLQTGNNLSRAIEGDYKTAGLYKIDENGNITAVAVYFQTDTLGNKLEHEEILRVAPKAMFNISDNYLLFADCDYYDCDGDLVKDKWGYDDANESYMIHQDVPYKNLIVRKSDGKIWCIDNVAELIIRNNSREYSVYGSFQQDKKGTLFYCNGHVFKFNLDGYTGEFEQITKNPITNSENFNIWGNDIVLSAGKTGVDYRGISISWPKSGFQYLNPSLQDVFDETKMDLGFLADRVVMERIPSSAHLLFINDEPYVIIGIRNDWYIDDDGVHRWWFSTYGYDLSEKIRREYMWREVSCLAKIIIGETPGSAYYDKAHITLTDTKPIKYDLTDSEFTNTIASVYSFSNYILTSNGESHSLVSILDLETSEWEWLKRMPFRINFNEANMYEGRMWQINDDRSDLGAFWFNPKELTDGFVAFNVQLPEYMSRRNWYISNDYNKVIFGGVNPSTGNYENIVIDVVSGNEIEQSITEPEMIFGELIPLN